MQPCKHQEGILGILMGVKAPASNPKILSGDQVRAWSALLFARTTVTGRMESGLLDRHRLSFSAYQILSWRRSPSRSEPYRANWSARAQTRASRLVQDAGHLQRGADQVHGRVSLISFTESGRHFAQTAKRSFEESVRKYFVDPLDDDDIAALTRIWAKLERGGGQD